MALLYTKSGTLIVLQRWRFLSSSFKLSNLLNLNLTHSSNRFILDTFIESMADVGGTTPLEARRKLAAEIVDLQNQLASLLLLRTQEGRRELIGELRTQISDISSDIDILDEVIAATPRPIPSAETNHHARPAGGAEDMLRSQGADFPFNRAELRLPSSLPVFRGSGISDPDAFIEQLSNNLLAHGISPCRWTSALLLGCAETADASLFGNPC